MNIGTYWEKRVVEWQAIVDDEGNVWRLQGEEIVDIIESGTENLETSDYWQVMN